MPTIHIVRANARTRAGTGATMPVALSSAVGESLVSGAAAVHSTLTAVSTADIWFLKAEGEGRVRVAFGVNAVASATSPWVMKDGDRLELGATVAGERVSVIDA